MDVWRKFRRLKFFLQTEKEALMMLVGKREFCSNHYIINSYKIKTCTPTADHFVGEPGVEWS